MGMFDTVLIKCPVCNEVTEDQTKDGDCEGRTFEIYQAPPRIIGSYNNKMIDCESCGYGMVIIVQQVVTVT